MIQVFQSIPKPVWVDIPYNAADFTATTGTWAVQSGDVNFLRYSILNKTCFFRLAVNDTGNSDPTTKLLFQLPAAITSIGLSPAPFAVFTLSPTAAHTIAWVEISTVDNKLQIRRNGDLDFPANAGSLGVSVSAFFQIN